MVDNKDIIVNKFNEDSVVEFRQKVLERSMLDPNIPIVVYIDSYGGYVDSCNAMIETLRQVPNPIVTVCLGKAMSCGAVLLAAGDHRFCGKNSRVMIHQTTSGDYGPTEELRNSTKEAERLNDMFMQILAERCNKSLNELKELIKKNEARDLYLDAKACLEFGIVDQIGMPIIKPIVLYNVEPAPEKKFTTEPVEIKNTKKANKKSKSKVKK